MWRCSPDPATLVHRVHSLVGVARVRPPLLEAEVLQPMGMRQRAGNGEMRCGDFAISTR